MAPLSSSTPPAPPPVVKNIQISEQMRNCRFSPEMLSNGCIVVAASFFTSKRNYCTICLFRPFNGDEIRSRYFVAAVCSCSSTSSTFFTFPLFTPPASIIVPNLLTPVLCIFRCRFLCYFVFISCSRWAGCFSIPVQCNVLLCALRSCRFSHLGVAMLYCI